MSPLKAKSWNQCLIDRLTSSMRLLKESHFAKNLVSLVIIYYAIFNI